MSSVKGVPLKYIFLTLTLLISTVALAHEWYPLSCCSGHDCHPVDCDSLIQTTKGITYQSYEFVKDMIKPSQDNLCHVCISNEFSKEMTPVPHCVFIQSGS